MVAKTMLTARPWPERPVSAANKSGKHNTSPRGVHCLSAHVLRCRPHSGELFVEVVGHRFFCEVEYCGAPVRFTRCPRGLAVGRHCDDQVVRCERRGVALSKNSESDDVAAPGVLCLGEDADFVVLIGWDDPPVAFDSVDFASGEYVDLVPLRISDRVPSQREGNGDAVSGGEVIECVDLEFRGRGESVVGGVVGGVSDDEAADPFGGGGGGLAQLPPPPARRVSRPRSRDL